MDLVYDRETWTNEANATSRQNAINDLFRHYITQVDMPKAE